MASAIGIAVERDVDPGAESFIILQSLLCLLREKNVLSRADLELLAHKVEQRAAGGDTALPCCTHTASVASADLRQMMSYLGQRYGGMAHHRSASVGAHGGLRHRAGFPRDRRRPAPSPSPATSSQATPGGA